MNYTDPEVPQKIAELSANLNREWQRRRTAVCDAAKVWANNDKGFTRIALRQAALELWEFENRQPQQSEQ